MKFKNEYRLIHPKQLFSKVLNILKEYSLEIEKERESTENQFQGKLACSFLEENNQKIRIEVSFEGIYKVWKRFEPLGQVWRVTLTVNIAGGDQKFLEEFKEKLFQRTLRGGG